MDPSKQSESPEPLIVVVVVIVFAAEAANVPFVVVAAPIGIVVVGSRPGFWCKWLSILGQAKTVVGS